MSPAGPSVRQTSPGGGDQISCQAKVAAARPWWQILMSSQRQPLWGTLWPPLSALLVHVLGGPEERKSDSAQAASLSLGPRRRSASRSPGGPGRRAAIGSSDNELRPGRTGKWLLSSPLPAASSCARFARKLRLTGQIVASPSAARGFDPAQLGSARLGSARLRSSRPACGNKVIGRHCSLKWPPIVRRPPPEPTTAATTTTQLVGDELAHPAA